MSVIPLACLANGSNENFIAIVEIGAFAHFSGKFGQAKLSKMRIFSILFHVLNLQTFKAALLLYIHTAAVGPVLKVYA